MNDNYYLLLNYLPEEVLSSLIDLTRDEEKEELVKSVRDKEFIIDLMKSRIKAIPTWMEHVLEKNAVLITENYRDAKAGWIFLADPFNTGEYRSKYLKAYFEIEPANEYDKITACLMLVTTTLMTHYINEHITIDRSKLHLLWYAEMKVVMDLFNDSLTVKFTDEIIKNTNEAYLQFDLVKEIVDLFNLKLNTGDII